MLENTTNPPTPRIHRRRRNFRNFSSMPRIILAVLLIAVVTLSTWYLINRLRDHGSRSLESYQKQLPKLKKRAEKKSDDYEANNEYAYALYVTSNNQEAIEAYNKTLSLNDQDSRSLNNLGNLYRKEKEYTAAIDAYRKAIEADPKNINPYINLANLYIYDLYNMEDGYKVFDEVIAAHPENVDIKIMLAKIYQQQGDKDMAKETYNQVLGVDSDNSAAQAGINQLEADE